MIGLIARSLLAAGRQATWVITVAQPPQLMVDAWSSA